MPKLMPFGVTVCGIDELADHRFVGCTHVLSILDPAAVSPPVFSSYGEHDRLELRFHDVIEENMPDHVVPERRHVEAILRFGRDLVAEPKPAHLLVHCHMGISRSSAALALILAQARPDWVASEILSEVVRIRSRAWPNLRMIELGEALLGRRGEMVAAVSNVYLKQLQRRPELERFFRENGRVREIELASNLPTTACAAGGAQMRD